MAELRKDYVLDRWVIIAPKRKARPQEFKEEKTVEGKSCDFCPGNEAKTPPEIFRLGGTNHTGGWQVRVFPHKLTAVSLTEKKAFGSHEIIVETPDHNKQLKDLSKEEIRDVLKVYAIRIKELRKVKGINYVLIFKNKGLKAGASKVHSHSQVLAYSKVPFWIQEEAKACKNTCPYCSIIKKEAKSKRFCFDNKDFTAFAPYAPRFNYELWIFSKKHIRSITEMKDDALINLAEILKKALLKINKVTNAYNFVVHNSPVDGNLHFHIEIYPRISIFAGFEFGGGYYINVVSPEEAALFYRK